MIGLAAHAAVDGVSCGTESGGYGAEDHVGFGQEFLVSPFRLLLPVDFAAFDLADVVPQFGCELFFLPVVETAESSRHDLRVAAPLLPPRL